MTGVRESKLSIGAGIFACLPRQSKLQYGHPTRTQEGQWRTKTHAHTHTHTHTPGARTARPSSGWHGVQERKPDKSASLTAMQWWSPNCSNLPGRVVLPENLLRRRKQRRQIPIPFRTGPVHPCSPTTSVWLEMRQPSPGGGGRAETHCMEKGKGERAVSFPTTLSFDEPCVSGGAHVHWCG